MHWTDQVGGTAAADELVSEGRGVDNATDQAATEHQPCISHAPQQFQAEQPAPSPGSFVQ